MNEHNVIPVQFKKVGKRYYFATNGVNPDIDDFVVVETARGIELGMVSGEEKTITDDEVINDLKPVLRIATEKDLNDYEANKVQAKKNFDICKQLILEHELEMKLLNAEYTLDRKKIVFYYTAEERVDFRELVKDLAKEMRTRVELRQVGERDGAKALGGLGFCGRELCCSTHLCEFDTISIKMAKKQNLSLNPTKITGLCGKLLCCIKYEHETYIDLQKNLPKVGEEVTTPNCKGCKVIDVDILKQEVLVHEEDKNIRYKVDELNGRNSK